MRFKPGQQVVCTAEWWKCKKKFLRFWSHWIKNCYGPKQNEIVTVYCYSANAPNMIVLNEYLNAKDGLHGYDEQWFEPLADISELKEILEQQPKTV